MLRDQPELTQVGAPQHIYQRAARRRLDDEALPRGGEFLARVHALLAWLYPELLPYWWTAVGSWLLLTALSAVSAAPILLARKIVQDFEGSSESLRVHLVFLAAVILAMGLLRFIGTLTLSSVTFRVRHALEEKFARRLASTPLSYYENNTSGSISLAAFDQVPLLAHLIETVFRNFLQAGTTILIAVVALFYSDLSVGAFSVLLLPFFFLGVRCFGKSAERSIRETFTRIADLRSQLLESLMSVKTIRTLGISERRMKDLGRITGETMRDERRTLILIGISRFMAEAVFAVGAVVVLLLLHAQFANGKISLALCAAALAGFGLLARESRLLANGIMEMRRIVGASAQAVDFLAQPMDGALQGTRQGPADVLEVVLSDVTFSYDNNVRVLRDVNMEFRRGEVSGIVGVSGAGKSTLADLLLRLRLPTSGRILVNGIDLTEFREEWIRETFAFVDQEPYLFNTTIRENLLLAADSSQEVDLTAALTAASAMDFVAALPDGLGSRVGEGGCLLSVGQKQRIALARALVRQPSVLVLDEITSALDPQNEKIILQALRELAPKKVIILISHKDRVTACCDRIYVLDEGRAFLAGG